MADATSPSNSWLWGTFSALGLSVAAVTFVLDQANKWWMLNVYDIIERGRVAVLPFMDVVFELNRGISYGLLKQDDMNGQYLLAGFACVVAVALTVMLARGTDTRFSAVGLGLIIGGALGNALDRLHLGGVADFYLLHGFGYSWYVFNIADVAIVFGVVALIVDMIYGGRTTASNGA